MKSKEKASTRRIKLAVKPSVLYRPCLNEGNSMPDPKTEFQLFDRVVNVREGYAVPLGLRGTVVGLHPGKSEVDMRLDVIFDEEFLGAVAMRTTRKSGYRLPASALIDLSYGRRVVNPPKQQPNAQQQQQQQQQQKRGQETRSTAPRHSNDRRPPPPHHQQQSEMVFYGRPTRTPAGGEYEANRVPPPVIDMLCPYGAQRPPVPPGVPQNFAPPGVPFGCPPPRFGPRGPAPGVLAAAAAQRQPPPHPHVSQQQMPYTQLLQQFPGMRVSSQSITTTTSSRIDYHWPEQNEKHGGGAANHNWRQHSAANQRAAATNSANQRPGTSPSKSIIGELFPQRNAQPQQQQVGRKIVSTGHTKEGNGALPPTKPNVDKSDALKSLLNIGSGSAANSAQTGSAATPRSSQSSSNKTSSSRNSKGKPRKSRLAISELKKEDSAE